MKAIERYVFGSFLSSFVLAFLVLSFVLTIGLLVQIVGYIVDGMPIGLVGHFAAVSFPETLQWTIPLALLVSSVLVFSRLSADSEIAAMRSCGINLLMVMKWPVLFALGCSVLGAWINNEIVPRGHEVRRRLTSKLSVGDAVELIEPGRKVTDFPNVTLYVARKEGRWLYDVTATDTSDTNVVRTIHAEKALASGEGQDMALDLYMVKIDPVEVKNSGMASGSYVHYPIKVKESRYIKKGKDLRFFELLGKIRADRAAMKSGAEPRKEGRRNLSKLKVELSKRLVFAMASICFVLVGIPLGIRSQRKESTIGMAISLAIALGYYLFVMLMLSMQKAYAIHPEFLIWLPVGVCLALSAWFVKRNL